MTKHAVSKLSARVDELRRDWPLLVADDDLGHRFSALLDDEELEELLEDFLVPEGDAE
jgi:hypothetical protein